MQGIIRIRGGAHTRLSASNCWRRRRWQGGGCADRSAWCRHWRWRCTAVKKLPRAAGEVYM